MASRRELDTRPPGALPEAEIEARERGGSMRCCSHAPRRRAGRRKVKNAIRALMWDKVGVEKDAASLHSALDDIEEIRLDLLPRMSVARTGRAAQLRMARRHRRR